MSLSQCIQTAFSSVLHGAVQILFTVFTSGENVCYGTFFYFILFNLFTFHKSIRVNNETTSYGSCQDYAMQLPDNSVINMPS
jgi:hypothetical protein